MTDVPARPAETAQVVPDASETINIPVAEAPVSEKLVSETIIDDSIEPEMTATVESETGESVVEGSEKEEPIVLESLVIPENDITAQLDQRAATPEITEEILFPEDVIEAYMIKPGDYLVKIARNEYGDPRKWRDIYTWNQEEIGNDPNLIYPFNFLNLLKPADQAKTCQLSFSTRAVENDESLWTIAKQVYGNELAWIVLYWDNEELLDSNEGLLIPGTELKIRDQIDPCMASN